MLECLSKKRRVRFGRKVLSHFDFAELIAFLGDRVCLETSLSE
jgi:hypothetical protein